MAIYQNTAKPPPQEAPRRGSVRPPPVRAHQAAPDEVRPTSRKVTRSRSVFTPINVVLIGLIVVIMVALVGWKFGDRVELPDLTSESPIYLESASAVSRYDQVIELVGSEPSVRDAGDSEISWGIGNGKKAFIHVLLEGEGRTAEARMTWVRTGGSWIVTEATWNEKGFRAKDMPLANGRLMTGPDLLLYRDADPDTHLGRGIQAILQGKGMVAMRELREDINARPNDPVPLYWRGRAFEDMGSSKKAMQDYRRALELDANLIDASVRIDALTTLN